MWKVRVLGRRVLLDPELPPEKTSAGVVLPGSGRTRGEE